MTNLDENLIGLRKKANEIRKEIVRLFSYAGGGHFGGSLSCVDIITALYYKILKIDPMNPLWEERDRFILSKGHSCLTLYIVLADLGFFPKEVLEGFGDFGNPLTMHPDMEKVPGIEFSTGSMGHGMPIGVGIALAAKMKKINYRTVVLVGDGELHEGSNWEAAMFAAHHKLENLIVIVDKNKFGCDDLIDNIVSIDPLEKKWQSFNWGTKVIDGHNIEEIVTVLEECPISKNKPSVIIANTIKGKGISFYENKSESHRIDISREQAEKALKELESVK